ncbi:MAG: CPBP family intramembrane glutamic endopeptidase [Bacteroidota bacterium]
MKSILKYLKQHVKEDFSIAYYGAVLGFLTLSISVNYYLDFEDSIIDSYYGKGIRIFYFFLFYAFAYYGTCLIMMVFKSQSTLFGNKWFWIKSLFILSVLALDAGFHYHDNLVRAEFPPAMQYLARKVSKNLINVGTMIVPMLIFYHLLDKERNRFYGLTWHNFNYKPYLFMLAVMIPVIFLASFIDNFSNFYPIYKSNPAHTVLGTGEWLPAILYELAYGWNFLTIELAFRGFMILGLTSIMGRNVVLPMVVTYCFYHFGKPAGEAISSIAGGYILGVIALESRSIFGGVLIHVGVAWLMELFAWLQKEVY